MLKTQKMLKIPKKLRTLMLNLTLKLPKNQKLTQMPSLMLKLTQMPSLMLKLTQMPSLMPSQMPSLMLKLNQMLKMMMKMMKLTQMLKMTKNLNKKMNSSGSMKTKILRTTQSSQFLLKLGTMQLRNITNFNLNTLLLLPLMPKAPWL